MWFKNLTSFRFTAPFGLEAAEVAEKLSEAVFRPCTSQAMTSHGWVPPLGRKAADLIHAVNGRLLLCLQAQEKVLPPAVLRELTEERILDIEEQQARSVRRREKAAIRDEVLQELLPRALTRTRRTYAYLSPADGWLVVDAASPKAVEELTGLLRRTLGSLPIAPPRVASAPAVIMTHWLGTGKLPPDLAPGDACELHDGDEQGGVVRCKGQDLVGDEIRTHLEAGKQVTRLGLRWRDRVEFLLGEDLTIRRLRFLDLIQEQIDDLNAATAEEVFDAQFSLMTAELALLLPQLLEVFGGEVTPASADPR